MGWLEKIDSGAFMEAVFRPLTLKRAYGIYRARSYGIYLTFEVQLSKNDL